MTRSEVLELKTAMAVLLLCILIIALSAKVDNQAQQIDKLTSTIESMLQN